MDASDLCRYGCYWDCEHREPASTPRPSEDAWALDERSRAIAAMSLHPAEDTLGRPLQRCRDCGDFFYSALEHARDHEQLRQLGMIPDDPLPQPWGRRGS